MTNIDVLLSSDSIDVLGASSKLDVDLSIGATGERGSNIFVGSGKPNLASVSKPLTPKTYDMFINLEPDDTEYLYLYQYLNVDGEFTWVALLRLIPNTFLTNYMAKFENGSAKIYIPITSVIPLASIGIYRAENFNVQHTIISTDPTASSIFVDGIIIDPISKQLNLEITINAAKSTIANPGTWSKLVGDFSVHLIVTVV